MKHTATIESERCEPGICRPIIVKVTPDVSVLSNIMIGPLISNNVYCVINMHICIPRRRNTSPITSMLKQHQTLPREKIKDRVVNIHARMIFSIRPFSSPQTQSVIAEGKEKRSWYWYSYRHINLGLARVLFSKQPFTSPRTPSMIKNGKMVKDYVFIEQ